MTDAAHYLLLWPTDHTVVGLCALLVSVLHRNWALLQNHKCILHSQLCIDFLETLDGHFEFLIQTLGVTCLWGNKNILFKCD